MDQLLETPAQNELVPAWKRVFRAWTPLISTEGLLALRDLLVTDDPRLLQGATTTPPPLMAVQDWPVEAACPIGSTGWLGDGLVTVAEVEEYFARQCYEVDQILGEPAGCRWALNWFDETPREQMRSQLLPEVNAALALRLDDDVQPDAVVC